MEYNEYRLVWLRENGRMQSRQFDWADFDVIEDTSGVKRSVIESHVEGGGWMKAMWGASPCIVMRQEDRTKRSWMKHMAHLLRVK